ncbi:NAD(P)-dependent oxidoreductase [Desulfogranum japonicum]|uniref:NAD(P)-dependent oxidoreductase n=1 Tax=Desulfogranum japonicum TaxID=231447 RepID=UPI0004239CDF|nr:NAD(P)-dependent oxidoreductase [Desulfogranum japonicum]
MSTYGFLGLGIMGTAMATNLIQAGFDVTVWNRTNTKCAPLVELGAKQGESAAAVVAGCDITFGMVSDPEAALSLCFEKGGVLEGITEGKSYIDVSTVDPDTASTVYKAIQNKGGRYLEAPVSGSKQPAEDGTLVFLCSGDESLYSDAQEALDVMGKKSFYFPLIGQGAQMKLIINMVMGTMMTAFAEGLSLGQKVGLQPNDIIDVIAQGAINNPMFQLKGPRMTEGMFATAFPLKHMQKDMRLALLLGDAHNQPLHTSSAANNAYIRAKQNGYGEEDFSAVIKNIEK